MRSVDHIITCVFYFLGIYWNYQVSFITFLRKDVCHTFHGRTTAKPFVRLLYHSLQSKNISLYSVNNLGQSQTILVHILFHHEQQPQKQHHRGPDHKVPDGKPQDLVRYPGEPGCHVAPQVPAEDSSPGKLQSQSGRPGSFVGIHIKLDLEWRSSTHKTVRQRCQ